MHFDHGIDRDNVKILKSESHTYRRRVAESFLVNEKARLPNVINRHDDSSFPPVYSVFTTNKLCLMYYITLCTCAHSWFYDIIIFLLLHNGLPC